MRVLSRLAIAAGFASSAPPPSSETVPTPALPIDRAVRLPTIGASPRAGAHHATSVTKAAHRANTARRYRVGASEWSASVHAMQELPTA